MFNDRSGNNTEVQDKIIIIMAIAAVIFVSLIIRIGYLQIFKNNNLSAQSQRIREKIIRINPIRGRILTNDNQIVANNIKNYNVYIYPKSLSKNLDMRQKSLIYLGRVLNYEYADIEYMISNSKVIDDKILISENVSFDTFIKITENSESMPGIEAEERTIRNYPFKNRMSHVLGQIGAINANEYSKLKDQGYKRNDWIGKTGIEGSYEKELKGEEGYKIYAVDATRNMSSIVLERSRDPIPGYEVELSINFELQKAAEDILADRTGGMVVMKPATGEVLAMASFPNYDPNIYILSNDANYESKKKLDLDTKGTPLLNRTIQAEYPPGSTFKMVSAFAILEENIVPLNKTYFCNGHYRLNSEMFGCWSVHGTENIYDAITNSCDVYFYNTSLLVTIERISQYANKLGFNKSTGVDLPYERPGLIPSRQLYKERGLNWWDGNTLITSIGQGEVKVTLMQLASYVSVIANKGYNFKPRLVNKIIDPVSGEVVKAFKPEKNIIADFGEDSFNFIHSAMRNVCVNGTGGKAFYGIRNIQFAGKTGTAEVGIGSKKQTHSLFVGFGPIDKPIEEQIAVAIIVEFENNNHLKYAGNLGAMIMSAYYYKEDYINAAKRCGYPVKESYN